MTVKAGHLQHAQTNSNGADAEDLGDKQALALAVPSGADATEELQINRFAQAKVDSDGHARPSRLAIGVPGANIYQQQLNNGRHRRAKQQNTRAVQAPHPPPPRQPPQTPLGALKTALQERGFKDAIDAYTFFDADRKGSITRGDLQKGLLALRIFKVTAKSVPFPKMGADGIDRMDLLQFLVLCAWDDSLNEILAMQRSDIEGRLQDSYNRSEQISAAALEEAGKSTNKSNADLKAQVLQGLTDLPDLFNMPPNKYTAAHRRKPPGGSQTDRSHGRGGNGVKMNNGAKQDGSQTERESGRGQRAHLAKLGLKSEMKLELKSEMDNVFGVPGMIATCFS